MADTKRFCARCKAEIPAERIEIMPETRVCVACAQAMGGSEFKLSTKRVRVSKVGSLKVLTADCELEKQRKPITPLE